MPASRTPLNLGKEKGTQLNGINLSILVGTGQSFSHFDSRSIQAVVLFWPAFHGSWFASTRSCGIDFEVA
jgi:hypothetical protein